jgi:hypothetical protein
MLRNRFFLATLALFASCDLIAQTPGGSVGDPAPDAKQRGVVNEGSAERPQVEMNPHPDYSNTDKKVDQAPAYAPGTAGVPQDNAPGPQRSGETATTPTPVR